MVKNKKCMDNYLNALLEGKPTDDQIKLLDQVILFSNAISGNENVWLFLNSPLMSSNEKQGVLENFSKKLKVESSVLNLFVLFVKNKRLNLTTELIKICHNRKDDIAKISNVELISSQEFSKQQEEALLKKCEELGFLNINLTSKIDSTMVFGFKLRTKDKLYDMSLSSVFEEFKEKLIKNN